MRYMDPSGIRQERKRIEKSVEQATERLALLQKKCPHKSRNPIGDVRNEPVCWEQRADVVDVECADCGYVERSVQVRTLTPA